jgi:hypothetical protein
VSVLWAAGGARARTRAAAAAVTPPPEVQVQQTLSQYGAAYSALDAGAARAVWPGVDERALARAFASLDSQQVVFDRCDVEVAGSTARASCVGRATYVPKVGRREAQTEPRSWTFALRQDGNGWKIERADVRRQ